MWCSDTGIFSQNLNSIFISSIICQAFFYRDKDLQQCPLLKLSSLLSHLQKDKYCLTETSMRNPKYSKSWDTEPKGRRVWNLLWRSVSYADEWILELYGTASFTVVYIAHCMAPRNLLKNTQMKKLRGEWTWAHGGKTWTHSWCTRMWLDYSHLGGLGSRNLWLEP